MNAGRDDDDALWSAYLDGTLEPQARARAEARLRTSAADRETLEAMRVAEAQLRTTAVPDPGAAYWHDFGARVESRLQPAARSQADPALIYEKLVGWLVNGGRVRWMRAAGALAGLTLVTYIGMRGFRPSEVRMHPSAPSMETNLPTPDPDRRDAPKETGDFRSSNPEAVVVPPPTKTKQRTEHDGSEWKSEAEATQAPAPPTAGVTIPAEPQSLERTQETELQQALKTFATEPQPATVTERFDRIIPKPGDAGSVDLQVRGGRASDLMLRAPLTTTDKELLVLKDRAAYVAPRAAADSLASYLAQALRDDAPRAREEAAQRAVQPRANQLNETAPGVVGKPTASAPAPPPIPPPLPATAEVDRLLHLADLAQRYEADPTFRPHLETIAMRLADYARQDPRAASRARTLMRTLAASSATASERAAWEDRLRQLPP